MAVLSRSGARALQRCLAPSAALVPSAQRFLHAGSSQAQRKALPASIPQVRRFAVVTQAVKDFGGESITEGTLVEITKKVGDAVKKGDILASIETDKVAVEVVAEESGALTEILVNLEDTVVVGQPMFKIDTEAAGAAASASAPAAAAPAAAAPAAAAPASTEGLTGIRAGFALARAKREAFAQGLPMPGAEPAAAAAPPAAAAAPVGAPAAVSVGEGRTERRVPMSPIRSRVIQRLKDSQNTMALLTTFQEVDMTAALEVRSKYGEIFQKKHGVPLGLLSLFLKASASGLVEIPGVNGFIDDDSKEIIYRKYADISVPIPSPRGPVSCVVRNVESQSVVELERSIASLTLKARTDQLAADDLAPASFGIVDGGSVGSMLSTAIVNPPAAACMGTNAIQQRAAMVGGKVMARPMMFLSLTYDHRLVDGREAVTFLAGVRDKLEDPARLILEV